MHDWNVINIWASSSMSCRISSHAEFSSYLEWEHYKVLGIGVWHLVENQQQEYKETRLSHTTSSCRKSTKLSLVTEPSMISFAVILSNVRIGRIENLLPWTKHFPWIQCILLCGQPLHLLDVLSSFEASSPNTSISRLGARSASQFV